MSETPEPVSVALCGLGNMGGAILPRLTAGPWSVRAFDLDGDRTRAAAAAHGATAADGVEELAEADVVVLSLPSPRASLEVAARLAPLMRAGAVIVETSTVNPPDMEAVGRVCADSGVGAIDAAILSGVAQMAAGTATLLVGGEEADVRRVRPVLDAISASTTRFGRLGSGMAAKVINNAVAHAVMVVLSEAGALAAATGVSAGELADLLGGPEAGLTRPLTHRFVERVMRGDYDGGMPTEAARKDSTLALALAQETAVPLFALQSTHTVYELGMANGLGRSDYASIATLWEQWTGRPMNGTPADPADGNPA
ncbi:3-hydroxyisobutyrate dehydrogenase [Murinocardiopsis flavida]|uniref:3-hydroxyisobutyrate dehydrogenase n=1 Tax=Murinocardiopsis flavida TaxID=645275 RepID=A0A2P8DTS4_9ACTN|nr:NAD(P)-dependent oxidoreductase [Murinocardiopsis flavida]PSL00592.1 3-hydroxyisobutyrate dehydrogenase [Murinocardiopsis flavida]